MARLNAAVPDDLRKRVLHALVDEDISFAEWIRRQIDSCLAERSRAVGKPLSMVLLPTNHPHNSI